MSFLELRQLTKYFDDTLAVQDLSLTIEDGEFLVFVGPSGCGKTTTLRMIAGLETISSGDLFIAGKKVNDVHPKDRDIAMVFQNYALYPHMTVYENMSFGLRLRKISKSIIDEKVKNAARILGIEALLKRKPKALSGGQRQRVAMGRAIVREPKVFLFDEPLSNLDAKMRVQMRVELKLLQKRLATTTVYVTHDQVEAMTLASRIAVMNQGRLQQLASPSEVYEHPANRFVAEFIGSPSMNFIDGVYMAKKIENKAFSMAHSMSVPDGTRVTIGIRPQKVAVTSTKPANSLAGRIDVIENLGSERFAYCSTDLGVLVVKLPDANTDEGDNVYMSFDPALCHFFDESGANIGGDQ